MEKRIRKVGEEVVLKTLDEMINEFGKAKDGTINCEFGIIPQMADLFGKKYTITEIQDYIGIPCYILDNMHWWFSEDMFKETEEREEEEEENPTVVLVKRINKKTGLIEDECILSKETLERHKEDFTNDEKIYHIFKTMEVY